MHINVLCCFENLSYNAYTHKYLSKVDLIGALMKVAERTSSHPIQLEDMDPDLYLKLQSVCSCHASMFVLCEHVCVYVLCVCVCY